MVHRAACGPQTGRVGRDASTARHAQYNVRSIPVPFRILTSVFCVRTAFVFSVAIRQKKRRSSKRSSRTSNLATLLPLPGLRTFVASSFRERRVRCCSSAVYSLNFELNQVKFQTNCSFQATKIVETHCLLQLLRKTVCRTEIAQLTLLLNMI